MIAAHSSLLIFGNDKNQIESVDAKNFKHLQFAFCGLDKNGSAATPSGFALRQLVSASQANPIATFSRWAAFGA